MLDSDGDSETDEKSKELSVYLRKEATPEDKKKSFTNRITNMLNNYMDQSSLNPVDIRLLYGLTSKTPTSDKQEDTILTRHRLL